VGRILAILGAVVVTLVSARADAYRLKTTEDGAPVRWERQVLPVHLSAEVRAMLPEGAAEEALTIATEAWMSPGVPVFEVSEDDAPPAGRSGSGPSIGVYLPSDWRFERGRLAVTVSAYDARGRLLDTDVFLNPAYVFGHLERAGGRRFDLATVLTHELGHCLGLAESETPGAAMWPTIPPGARHRSVSEDDLAGLAEAYVDVPLEPAPVGGCVASVSGRTSVGWWPLAGVLPILWRRRRA